MQFQLASLFLLASTVLASPISTPSSVSSVTFSATAAPNALHIKVRSTTTLHGSMFGPPKFKVRKTSKA
ncbi:hypothetical protein C6P44_002531 [Monosporozyma unispora]|nr:hypothetical protein C6P44_002531 [Kazachstania unispora]